MVEWEEMDVQMQNYSDGEIERLMDEANERAHAGCLKRLRVLLSTQSQDTFPAPGLALEYHEEARLCWYVGAFVSTIIMTQLAFEELLMSHYRVANGVGASLDCGKKVDKAGFFDLINKAQRDGWISQGEAESLNTLRKSLRNPYVHVKDIKGDERKEKEPVSPNFLTQYLKIVASELIDNDVEDEAKEAILLLVSLFPKISSRTGGL